MSYVSLYRKFRPDGFDKVVGQTHIVRTLINQIKNNRIGHAYLFTGTRGTGKTSCAKIFARAVNCLNPQNGSPCNKCEVCNELSKPGNIDIIEMDAASNNGVEEIRQIKENSQYRPSVGRYKVYIIDEVHMLTANAFNALLKTLEEPPEFVIFILATTEVQKLPATILSRCMRFDFRLVSLDCLCSLLKRIYDGMNVKYEESAVRHIALHGEGSVRDALSIADMCMSYGDGNVTLQSVLEVLGASDFNSLDALGSAILAGKSGEALTVLEKLYSEGRNTLHKDLSNYFRDLLAVKNIAERSFTNGEEYARLKELGEKYDNYRIGRALDIICGIETALRYSSQPRLLLEAAVVKAAEMRTEESLEGLNSRIYGLEKKLSEKLFEIAENGAKQRFAPEGGNVTVSAQGQSAESSGAAGLTKGKAEAPKKAKAKNEKEERNQPDVKTVPDAENASSAGISDIAERLSGAQVVEGISLFEETEEDKEEAKILWRAILKGLEAKRLVMLCNACDDVNENVRLEDGVLIASTDETASYEFINYPNNFAAIMDCIKRESGGKYGFRAEYINSDESDSGAAAEIERLIGPKLIKK